MVQTEDILRTLVEIPTVTGDRAAIGKALDFIETFTSSRGLHVTRFDINGAQSLVATTRQTKTPTVMLVGHIDVVPAPDDFFRLRRVNDKYFGRGVHDMKDSISVFLKIIDSLQDRFDEYDFGLMITSDEEIGGFNGAAALLEKGYRPQVCVLPDGGDSWKLETHAKGLICADITAFGKTSHGSRPWEGENAILKLTKALEAIQAIFPNTDPTASTMSITQIKGGEAFNQVPDNATAVLDIRPTTSKDQAIIVNKLQDICDAHGVEVTLRFNEAPCINDRNNPYVKPFVESIEDALGRPVESTLALAGSDARHFTRYGIPCAVMYLQGGGHHSMGEWLSVDALDIFEKAMMQYLDRVAYTPIGNQLLTKTTHL